MADCGDLPTKADAELFKQDAGTTNEFVTLEADLTSPASDGKQKKTLWGIANDGNEAVAKIIEDGAEAVFDIKQAANVILPPVPYGTGQIVDNPVNPDEYAINQAFEYDGVYVRFAGLESELPYDLTQAYDNTKWTPVSDNDAYTADQLSRISPDNIDWDVELPLGNQIVKKLDGALEFTRATTRGNTNKSGGVETVGIDEPAITKDGMSFYGAATNLVYPSEGFTGGDGSGWTNNGTADIIENTAGHESPYGSLNAGYIKTNGTAGVGLHASRLNGSGEDLFFSVWLRGEAGGEVVAVGGSSRPAVILTTEWERYSFYVTGNTAQAAAMYTASGNTGDTAWYYWGYQATETSYLTPYIKTEDAAVTSGPDLASIPVRNNMPGTGQPWTIVIDCAFPKFDDPTFSKYLLSTTSANLVVWRFNGSSTSLALRVRDDVSGLIISRTTSDVDNQRHRFAFVSDGSTIYTAIDGVMGPAVSACVSRVDPGESINFCRDDSATPSAFLGDEVKNFRIIHRALSDDEIKALGGPDNA